MTEDLSRIKALIHSHCGLVLEGIAEERLRKALQKNTLQTGCGNLQDYERLIRRDAEQLDHLVSQMTVNETYFFREPEQIALCVNQLIPRIQALPERRGPVRILSAGCSSGEEPYSLVMALRERYGRQTVTDFQVDAGDLDQQVLQKAREGIYSAFSFRGVEESIRYRYFRPLTQGYQLALDIRNQVEFYELNLLAPVLPANLRNYDLIFFRNVSIYFDLETRRLIHRRFHELMPEQAILLLGSSETLGNDLGVFDLVEEQGQYYFVKGDALKPPSDPASVWRSPDRQPLVPVAVEEPVIHGIPNFDQLLDPDPFPVETPVSAAVPQAPLPDLKKVRQLVWEDHHAQALPLLEELLDAGYEQNAAQLLKSWILLNRKAFEAADALLEQALEQDPWSVDALLMRGLSYKWQEQQDASLQWFKKATYTCPECWTAYYYLGDVYRQTGDDAGAARSYQAVRRILSSDRNSGDCTAWIPRLLPPGDTLFLAERHLLKYRETGVIAKGKDH